MHGNGHGLRVDFSFNNQYDSDFTFNALENIKMLAEMHHEYFISDALTSLGCILRYNLSSSSDYVSLREELLYIQHYIKIMNMRYEDKLRLCLKIEKKYWDLRILKLSLQTIIETVIAETSLKEAINITIRSLSRNSLLYIVVTVLGKINKEVELKLK